MYLINFWEEEKWECGTEASYIESKVGHSRILVWNTNISILLLLLGIQMWIEFWIINDQWYLAVILVILLGKGFIECLRMCCQVRRDLSNLFLLPPPFPPPVLGSEQLCLLDYSCSTEFCYQPLITFELAFALPWLTLNSLCSSALNFALQVVEILNLSHHPPFLRRGQLALYLLPFVLESIPGLPVDCSRQLYMDLDTELELLTSSAA